MPSEACPLDERAPTVAPVSFKLPREAGALLRRSERTLATWRFRGIGPDFVRLDSGRVLYTDEALDAYLQRCKRSPKRRPS